MHFSIPDTAVQTDEKGVNYRSYFVHINGVLHCQLRYRQFHSFHQQLRREFGPHLPSFPPKKLFTLNESEIEERRLHLEKYLQLVSQDARVSNSATFNTLLLVAQQETRRETVENINLEIFLMNEHRVTVHIQSVEQTDTVLEKVCMQLSVPEEYHYCFALFLIRRDGDGDITVARKLQDFESPFISQKALSLPDDGDDESGPLKIVLRKSCWDSSIDDLLLTDPVTLNLLYIQTVADIERGWILTSAETKQQLALMQAKGAKRQYMEVARSLKFYGYMIFRPGICDYPEPHTRATLALGRSCLNMRLYTPSGEIKEVVFKVTRIRCWRIMTSGKPLINGPPGRLCRPDLESKLELSFEYLVAADKLQWITVVSSQAILMSLCLQSMVEELVRVKAGEKDPSKLTRCSIRKHKNKTKLTQAGVDSPEMKDGCIGPVDYTVRKLAEKFSVVNMKSASIAAENVFVENEMFIEMSDTNSVHSL